MIDAGRLPPAGLTVRLDGAVRVRDGGRLLCGGAPFRLIRLTASGAAVTERWRGGDRLREGAAERGLARRLIDAGMLHTAPDVLDDGLAVEIVIPARDRLPQLRRCLTALAAHCPTAPVLVVDDGTTADAATELAELAREHGASLVRHAMSRGPSAARNTGLAATTGPLVAFIDSDVVVDAGSLARLAAHFADPAVGAAAPRVLALTRPDTWLGEYEAEHSSLDMGSRAASIGPGRAVPYVPSTTLVVRRSAVAEGFDERLDLGEDVDFVWRLVERGWRVVYDPEATVRHDHRLRPGAFWRRRWDYARSIGPLARRHPAALPAVHADPWSSAILFSVLRRRPGVAALLVGIRFVLVRARVGGHTRHPSALSRDLVGMALFGTARGLGHAVRRTWSPVLLLFAARSRTARVVLASAIALRLHDDRRPVRMLALALADDAVAALGTWAGCVAGRTTRPLLPARHRSGPPRGRQHPQHSAAHPPSPKHRSLRFRAPTKNDLD